MTTSSRAFETFANVRRLCFRPRASSACSRRSDEPSRWWWRWSAEPEPDKERCVIEGGGVGNGLRLLPTRNSGRSSSKDGREECGCELGVRRRLEAEEPGKRGRDEGRDEGRRSDARPVVARRTRLR